MQPKMDMQPPVGYEVIAEPIHHLFNWTAAGAFLGGVAALILICTSISWLISYLQANIRSDLGTLAFRITLWCGLAVLIAACIGFASGCSTALPHRAAWEASSNGQGHNPTPDCQGQYQRFVEMPDGSRFFLQCWGQR